MGATPADQIKYLNQTDQDFAKAHPDEQAAYLAHLTKQPMADAPKQEPEGFTSSFSSALGAPQKMSDYWEGPKQALMHPIDSAKMLGSSILGAQGDTASRGFNDIKKGNWGSGIADVVYGGIPLIGPTLSKASHQLQGGNIRGAAGTTLGVAAPIVAGKYAPAVGDAVAGRMGVPKGVAPNPIHPEVMARNTGNALSIPPTEMNDFTGAARKETPAIIDYAKRSGIPLKQSGVIGTAVRKMTGFPDQSAPLNFSNAARGAAESASQVYKDKVLGPYQNDVVPTTGTGFVGKNTGEGQQATLGEINSRIDNINDILRGAYSKKQEGQTMTSLSGAEQQALQNEKAGLTDILHQQLAKRTGTSPEEIANLRQTVGRRYSLADKAKATSNMRQFGESTSQTSGSSLPMGKMGALEKGLTAMRGGPEAIAGRRLTKSLKPYGEGNDYEAATKRF